MLVLSPGIATTKNRMSYNRKDADFEKQLSLNLDGYITLVGKIIVNLQSLEFALRTFLYSKKDGPHTPLLSGRNLNDYAVDEWVPENAMTSYDSLGDLIKRYNTLVDKEKQIDTTIVGRSA